MSEIESYLISKGWTFKHGTGNNVYGACFFHGEEPNKRGRLYVNTDDNADVLGKFICFVCGETGALNKIRKHFGDEPLSTNKHILSESRSEILEAAANYYYENLLKNDEALVYLLEDRGLVFDTIEKHKIGWADGKLFEHLVGLGFSESDIRKTNLVTSNNKDFFNGVITIPYHVVGRVVQIRGKFIGGKYKGAPGQEAALFNSDCTLNYDNNESIVICEGEFDALVMSQLGYNAVGVPGAQTWKEAWTEYLSDFKKYIICFDNDSTGHKAAEKLASSLGPASKIVELPAHDIDREEEKNDPSHLIVNVGWRREDFDRLFIGAKGGLLVTVDDAKREWDEYQQLINSGAAVQFGIEMLDRAIFPGLMPAQVCVIIAKTGVGKTLTLLNTFERIRRSQPEVDILFVSLEQTRGEWFDRARKIHSFYNLECNDSDVMDYYRDNLTLIDKNRVTEEELIQCIEQYEMEKGKKPGIIAVDYLGYWARSFKGEAYERTSAAIMALKAVAKDTRIPIIAPHQVSRMAETGEEPSLNSLRDSGVVEETADFVFALWTPDQRRNTNKEDRQGEIYWKILKSRHGGVGTKVSLQFDPLTLAMVPKGDPLWQRAKDGHDMYMNGDTYEEALYRHRTGNRDIILPAGIRR